MTQEQQDFQIKLQNAATQKGWFLAFIARKLIPFIIANWDEIFPKRGIRLMAEDNDGPKLPDPGTTPPPP